MLTIGRIVTVYQSGAEIPAIVSEVTGHVCCATGFPPRRSPVTITDLPWFRSRHDALEWLHGQSAQNTHVAYLPYHGSDEPPISSLAQVASELADNDEALLALTQRAAEAAAAAVDAPPVGRDLQDAEIGRTLPPITGQLNVPINALFLNQGRKEGAG